MKWLTLAGIGIAIALLIRLNRKVNHMPRQEDVDLIVNNLNQISTNVAGIASDQQALNDKITELQAELEAGNDIDLSDALELSNRLVEQTSTLDAAFPTAAGEPGETTGNDSNTGTGGDVPSGDGQQTTPITDPGSQLEGDTGGPDVGGEQ